MSNPFGKQRLQDFYLDPTYINLNHGSYGSCPKQVVAFKRQIQERMDFNTEVWFRKDSQIMIDQMRGYIAKQVNCKQKNIFITQNATDAFNSLMKSLEWKQGDIVLLPNIAYAAIRQTMNWIRDRYKIVIQDLIFTTQDLQSPESIQLKIQDTVNAFPKKIKCAVFDHISSVPAIIFPIEAIRQFLDQKNIELFVDGAHAMCHTHIDLTQLNVQGYLSNFHKWAFAPKNAAFLYISDKYLQIVRPAITGNFRGQGASRQFYWTGTRDFSSYLSIKRGIDYLQSFGSGKVHQYNTQLSYLAGTTMANIWKTKMLTSDKDCLGYMNNVQIPSNDIAICEKVQTQLMEKYNTYLVIYSFDGKIYTRISAQIYNDISDYQFVAQKFLEIIAKYKKQQEKHIKSIK